MICPLCNKEFETPIKLGNHLKSDDIRHQFLKELIKLDKKKNIDCQEVYDNHCELINNVNDLEESINDYKNYLQQQKEEIKQKQLEEKEEKQRQKEQEKINKIEAKKLAKLEKQKRDAEKYKEILEAKQFKKKHEKDFIKNLPTEYKPMNLIKYFYQLAGVREYNAIIATASIKSLYFTYQLKPEEVKHLLRYAVETGHSKISDVKFLIEESARFYEYAAQIKQEGTIPSFVKKFYTLKNSKIDKKMFIKYVDRIKSIVSDNNLTIEEIDKMVTYMAKANIGSLYWFGDYIHIARPQIHDVKEVTQQDITKEVKDVMNGNKKYIDIDVKKSYACFREIKNKIMHDDFDEEYNYMEFLYKIQMTPDKELIEFIKTHHRQSRFKTLFDKNSNNQEVLDKLTVEYNKYKKWVKQYGE